MKKSLLQSALVIASVALTSSNASAYLPVGQANTSGNQRLLKTTAGCAPAKSSVDLDINNVRATLMTGGDMWYTLGTNNAAYEVPKGGKRHSLYAGACWIGGISGDGQLKVTAQTFRTSGSDYWPGPIDRTTGDITATSCSEWDKFWKVNASVVQEFRQAFKDGGATAIVDEKFDVIKEWPATGNIYALGANRGGLPELLGTADRHGYAPFIDVNGDKIYNWKDGDYPRAYGVEGSNPSQFIWWIFNDKGNVKTTTKTQSIGMEVQTSAFAYSATDFMNDATFYNYRLINRGSLTLDSCFIATWTDADLGAPNDDYIGCDTARGLGILYNAVSPDGANGQNTYGTRLPMVGVDFFIGPRKYFLDSNGRETSRLLKMSTFSYYNNGGVDVRDPQTGVEFYNYMTGSTASGIPFSNDQSLGRNSKGYGSGPIAPFVFYGDPSIKSEWSMCSCEVAPADRRFIHSSGPFQLRPGEMNDITIGVVWVDDVGACGTGSFKKIRSADDIAQTLFDQGFKRTVGPEAPILTIREMDKKLIFYITNPSTSNNFNEQYGDPKYYVTNDNFLVKATKALAQKSLDSVYRFEGYQVFQLSGPNVSLFDENGNLSTQAKLVFQTDRKNGVSQIANFTKNLEYKGGIDQYNTTIKVEGKDSGIVHSFVLTQDQFASGNQTFANYKTYYYQIVAYAYNNFASFDPHNEVGTQDKPYLIGENGPGSTPIARYAAMPNAMNQKGDSFTHAQYGDGVIVTRIEGIGNGGNDVQINDTTEQAILMSPTSQVAYPTYVAGKGPVEIKVVDPVKVVSADWRIVLSGPTQADLNMGMADTSKWRIERLNSDGSVASTVYSERDLSTPNEQILAQYGLSVKIAQTLAPGVNQAEGNGYITSDVSFQNTALPWLSGVKDQSGVSVFNWIRSGTYRQPALKPGEVAPLCGPFDDYNADSFVHYNTMVSNNSNLVSTWAPYDLVATVKGNTCGFAPGEIGTVGSRLYFPSSKTGLELYEEYPNVDLVFTSDKSKWTRCVVLETQDAVQLSDGNVSKFAIRAHKSWNMGIDADGNPIYSTDKNDSGFSYFPGYAINQLTGERLNIAFGEDSYLKKYNGADMLWNPTADLLNNFGETVFGGRHFTYILNSKYDSCKVFAAAVKQMADPFQFKPEFRKIRWVGMPTLNSGSQLLSLKDGLIPTETRIRFRVNTPYKKYALMDGQVAVNEQNPLYKFTTKGMASDDYTNNTDAEALLDRVFAVPNPYKGQASGGNSYETNRLETKIKIINLPVKATINIYSLDGTLIRRLEKDNNDPAISWDLYNQAGLPIASGMYLIHVNAYGKNRVLRWFGAMRPLDVTNN